MANSIKITLIMSVTAVICALLYGFQLSLPNSALGSVSIGSDYKSTTTPSGFTSGVALKSEPGSLGSVVVSGQGSGALYFYDATTTNVNLRTGNKASSTLLLFQLPLLAATSTYTLDASFYDGLVVVIQGTAPTSTITWR